MQTFFEQFCERTEKRYGSIIARCIFSFTFVYWNYLSYFESTGISTTMNAVVI